LQGMVNSVSGHTSLGKGELQSMLEMPCTSVQRLTLAEILEGLWQVSTVTEGIFPVVSLR
jgi:hypothetical protein